MVLAGACGDGGPEAPSATDASEPPAIERFADPQALDATAETAPDGAVAEEGHISVEWRPIDHVVGAGRFLVAELTIVNGTAHALGAGWTLAFNSARQLLVEGAGNDNATQQLAMQGLRQVDPDVAEGGDVLAIAPLPGFIPIEPGERRTVRVLTDAPAIHKGDAPAGFYIVLPGESIARAVHASVQFDTSNPRLVMRAPTDILPVQTTALRYEENRALTRRTLGPADGLLPRPLAVSVGAGSYALAGDATIDYAPGLAHEAAYLGAALGDVLLGRTTMRRSGGPAGASAITLSLDAGLVIPGAASNAEGYSLDVTPGGVRIVGADPAGVFYGIQTLRQLVPRAAYASSRSLVTRQAQAVLPVVGVVDAPLFRYRGISLDVARHFQSKETVMKLLDVLAHYKLNTFHFHLSDDEGWRLEIPGLPELTAIGSQRGFDPGELTRLHSSHGSASGLNAGASDGIVGKARTDSESNGGAAPTYQGFEEATLNFVGVGSGYYTIHDFEQILAYAAERHIDVVPELDMPAHARAAVKAMEQRHRTYALGSPELAAQYRLVDPFDTSLHVTPQGVRDGFVNPCLESTYAFLDKVVHEIAARYAAVPAARLTMIHGGGDELPGPPNVWWQGSPACKGTPATAKLTDLQLRSRFLARWASIIGATGVPMAGWDDILAGSPKPEGFVAMVWNNVWGRGHEDDAYMLANGGTPVILAHATNLYLSEAENKDPDEPGSYWANHVDERKTFEYRPFDIFVNATEDRFGNAFAPSVWDHKQRLTESGKANIRGIEGCIWSENMKSPKLLEYFAFPKALGVAERAWAREMPDANAMPDAWEGFVNTLGQSILPMLDTYRAVDVRSELPRDQGINYRIPLPGARLSDGVLDANVRIPGLALEYSRDAGRTWALFTGPVPAVAPILLRTKTSDGRSSRIARLD